MSSGFVHLHLHTDFSLRDSTIRLPEEPEHIDPAKAPRPNLISRAVELRLPALAVTDLSNLFAMVKFYRAAEAAGIKPIIGADVFVEDVGGPTRLTLLCQNREGYLGLSRLLTRAYLEGHHGDFVAIRPEWLHAESHGLILLAGRDSPIGRSVRENRLDHAERILSEWRSAFDDRLYLELIRTQRPGDDAFNSTAIELASRHDLPLVASNDVRFLAREDFDAHEARVCIATGRVLDDGRRPHEYSAEQYLKSSEEMIALFADLPEAIENGLELAKRCNLELTFGKNYLPAFPVPADHTLETWMRRQSHEGLAARLAKYPVADGFGNEDYTRRLETELGVIIPMDFAGYFLIVADFINWAKGNDIPVGPGRGSGAGSLVAYALGITDLDPIRYDLLFERFLNPERVSMPDFDIDFCMDRRDEVIDYVAQKYGRERVSQIITYFEGTPLLVNSKHVYVTGFSAGAYMAHRVAVELSSQVAAIASVSGALMESSAGASNLVQSAKGPVSILMLNGDADLNVGYCGENDSVGISSSVDETFNYWTSAKANACATITPAPGANPSTLCDLNHLPTTIVTRKGASCLKTTEVIAYQLHAGTHQFYGLSSNGVPLPLNVSPGTSTAPFNINFAGGVGTTTVDVCWNFFQSHSKK